ncbi:conserved protein of unknown function [Georgfuchsia toluolica]|uniref:Uncharacterized protein n=1 Tax=Georgfuchsia toluolica TaxID=424218 RepID=A0A916J2I5_9PROT|nr:hypothetical protein [Georgfuchsia toluolica]CAG4883402.1 conserved protein of unknown function [Georgfuchsia toluolica]
MKTEHLHDIWAGPDNTRLTTKQFSFRFPVHIAAKIAALCDMYPQKNRTQIVADLLTSALDDLEQSLPEAPGDQVEPEWNDRIAEQIDEPGETLFYLGGARGRFRGLSNKHYRELEAELGNAEPELLFDNVVGTKEQFSKK